VVERFDGKSVFENVAARYLNLEKAASKLKGAKVGNY
jgi:hypothetical protein